MVKNIKHLKTQPPQKKQPNKRTITTTTTTTANSTKTPNWLYVFLLLFIFIPSLLLISLALCFWSSGFAGLYLFYTSALCLKYRYQRFFSRLIWMPSVTLLIVSFVVHELLHSMSSHLLILGTGF